MKPFVKITIILSLAFSFNSKAQINLVPNPSFELYTPCAPAHPDLWNYVNSTDYYNTCVTAISFSVPTNWDGYQYPNTGNGYVGMVVFAPLLSVNYKEFIWAQLKSQLIAGHTYYVNFYVSLGDSSLYAIKNLGVLFDNAPFTTPSVSANPQIEFTDSILTDKVNWVKVSGSFIATGVEQYITIGNFRDYANTSSQFVGNGGSVQNYTISYYYLDDVYVSETPFGIGISEQQAINFKLDIYPNPITGNSLTFEFESKINQNAQLQITNALGQIIYSQTLTNIIGKHTQTINLPNLAQGVYFLRLKNEKESVAQKFLKLNN